MLISNFERIFVIFVLFIMVFENFVMLTSDLKHSLFGEVSSDSEDYLNEDTCTR